jgi:hypothetical protein
MPRTRKKVNTTCVSNAIKGFQRATKLGNDATLVWVNPLDGCVYICARSQDDPVPPVEVSEEWGIPDEPQKLSVHP